LRRHTEVVIIHILVVYAGGPILPHTIDLEDGFLAGSIIVIDALGSKFMNDVVAKSQSANREVVKVALEITVLETQDDSGEIQFGGEMCRKRYLIVPPIIIPPLECKPSPTLPQISGSHSALGKTFKPRCHKCH